MSDGAAVGGIRGEERSDKEKDRTWRIVMMGGAVILEKTEATGEMCEDPQTGAIYPIG